MISSGSAGGAASDAGAAFADALVRAGLKHRTAMSGSRVGRWQRAGMGSGKGRSGVAVALTWLARLCWLVQLQRTVKLGLGRWTGLHGGTRAGTANGYDAPCRCVAVMPLHRCWGLLVGADGAKREGEGEVGRALPGSGSSTC